MSGSLRAIVVGLVLCSAATRAQVPRVIEEPGITGYVLTPDGTPVSNGTVVIPDFGRSTTTIDRTGRFTLVPPRSGPHQVLVSVQGLAPHRFSVSVPASRSLRLPVIRLAPAAYFRVRFVSAAGEPITAPGLRRRFFETSGNPLPDGFGDRISQRTDTDGAVVIGPLLRSILALAVDNRFFAQTRLPDVNVDGETDVDGGTVVVQQPGAVLSVDVFDGTGAPVPAYEVHLEDAVPRSPLAFRPVRTNQQGRATFDRIAAGRYRVWALAVELCANQTRLAAARDLVLSGTGTVETRLVVGGRATFHIALPFGPARGMSISASPNVTPPSPPRFGARTAAAGCRGVTDADGRVTLPNFPPGPAHVDVEIGSSTYVQQVNVPADGREIAVAIPDGFQPVRVTNAVTKQPVGGASISWTGGGARVEARTAAAGEALLEGVGDAAGSLAVSAPGYRPAEAAIDVPGVLQEISVVRVAATNLRALVMTTSGEPLPNAVVEVIAANRAAIPYVAATNAGGVVAFSDVSSGSLQLVASADGFVTSKANIGEARTAEVVLRQGYRVVADVTLSPAEGPQVVRVLNEAGASMDEWLDSASDRGFEPPARLSLGPLPPGAYVIELSGTGGRRQQRVQIVDRDVAITLQ